MVRLIAIAALFIIAYLLVRYRTNEKLQKGLIGTIIGGFLIYMCYVVISELMR